MGDQAHLITVAEAQHGLVARWQLSPEICSKSALSRRRAGPDWEALSPRVLRRRGSGDTPLQRAMAAVLDVGPDGVLSHSSAAALWGLPGFSLEPFHVTLPGLNRRTRTERAIVHRCAAMPQLQTTRLDDIPVVRPELMALQLCGSIAPARAERALDNAWSRRLLSGDSVRRNLDQVAASGRSGVRLLRQLLDARGHDYVPPASGLEARFERLLFETGLPPMRRQVDVGDDDAWTGRVDFRADDLPLIVEVNSEKYHTALVDREADRRRYARLEGSGFVVVAVTDTQVWQRPWEVVAAVRTAREAASTELCVPEVANSGTFGTHNRETALSA